MIMDGDGECCCGKMSLLPSPAFLIVLLLQNSKDSLGMVGKHVSTDHSYNDNFRTDRRARATSLISFVFLNTRTRVESSSVTTQSLAAQGSLITMRST
jgi:hypothetical protein